MRKVSKEWSPVIYLSWKYWMCGISWNDTEHIGEGFTEGDFEWIEV